MQPANAFCGHLGLLSFVVICGKLFHLWDYLFVVLLCGKSSNTEQSSIPSHASFPPPHMFVRMLFLKFPRALSGSPSLHPPSHTLHIAFERSHMLHTPHAHYTHLRTGWFDSKTRTLHYTKMYMSFNEAPRHARAHALLHLRGLGQDTRKLTDFLHST